MRLTPIESVVVDGRGMLRLRNVRWCIDADTWPQSGARGVDPAPYLGLPAESGLAAR